MREELGSCWASNLWNFSQDSVRWYQSWMDHEWLWEVRGALGHGICMKWTLNITCLKVRELSVKRQNYLKTMQNCLRDTQNNYKETSKRDTGAKGKQNYRGPKKNDHKATTTPNYRHMHNNHKGMIKTTIKRLKMATKRHADQKNNRTTERCKMTTNLGRKMTTEGQKNHNRLQNDHKET